MVYACWRLLRRCPALMVLAVGIATAAAPFWFSYYIRYCVSWPPGPIDAMIVQVWDIPYDGLIARCIFFLGCAIAFVGFIETLCELPALAKRQAGRLPAR